MSIHISVTIAKKVESNKPALSIPLPPKASMKKCFKMIFLAMLISALMETDGSTLLKSNKKRQRAISIKAKERPHINMISVRLWKASEKLAFLYGIKTER